MKERTSPDYCKVCKKKIRSKHKNGDLKRAQHNEGEHHRKALREQGK